MQHCGLQQGHGVTGHVALLPFPVFCPVPQDEATRVLIIAAVVQGLITTRRPRKCVDPKWDTSTTGESMPKTTYPDANEPLVLTRMQLR